MIPLVSLDALTLMTISILQNLAQSDTEIKTPPNNKNQPDEFITVCRILFYATREFSCCLYLFQHMVPLMFVFIDVQLLSERRNPFIFPRDNYINKKCFQKSNYNLVRLLQVSAFSK